MNFDEKLNKVLNDEIDIPESIIKKKNIAFEEIRKSKKKKIRFSKGFIAAAVLLIIITGTFAIKGEEVLATIKEFIFRYNQSIEKAIDNGYYEQLEDYVVSNEGVDIKMDKVILDSKTLFASFVIKFEDVSLLNELEDVYVDVDFDYKDKNDYPKYSREELEIDIENREIHYYFVYSLNKKINSDYLKININEITLWTNGDSELSWDPQVNELDKQLYETNGIKLFKRFKSTWAFDLDVNSIIKEDIKYSYSSDENSGEMEFVSAELSPTGMDIILKEYSELNFYDLSMSITEVKVTNNDGKSFDVSQMSIREDDNNIKHINMYFEATIFDENENFYLEIIKDDGTIIKFNLNKN